MLSTITAFVFGLFLVGALLLGGGLLGLWAWRAARDLGVDSAPGPLLQRVAQRAAAHRDGERARSGQPDGGGSAVSRPASSVEAVCG